jgi:putative RecB family exonuclease
MYSHSRLETFNQCPRKYKFRYVDRLKSDTEGVEAFMGKRVHEALEQLYKELKFTKLMTADETLTFYEREWEKHWHAHVQVVRPELNPGHYFELGRRCIADYYRRHAPFTQGRTLGLEERIEITLSDGERTYAIQGYIDRLSWDPDTETYEIHDYKTGSNVPTQSNADQDRQLALYQIGLLQRWPDAKRVKLVWHYLAADKEITSLRTTEDLASLEAEIISVIHRVEAELALGVWEPRTSALCDWCEYKPMCPAWKHAESVSNLPINDYLENSGVQLVLAYAKLEAQRAGHLAALKVLENEQANIAEAAIAYAQRENVTALDGPDHRLIIKLDGDLKIPRKMEDPLTWELLRTTLKNAHKLEDVSTVNGNMLKFALRRGKWPGEIVKTITALLKGEPKPTVSLISK